MIDETDNIMKRWRTEQGLWLMQIFLFFFSAALASSQPATDQLKNSARKFYWGAGEKQDYVKALNLYLEAARLGDAEAQFIAGGMYFVGRGTPKDTREAFRLLYQAALNGKSTAESQKILGQSFLVGLAAPKNYPEAVRWYQKASNNGDRDAQNELAFLYFVGHGVNQNPAKAFELFEKAAKSGLAIAQYNLGIMWYTGNGVEKTDLVQSYAWFNIAAANGYRDAEGARSFIESVLNQQELSRAQALSDDLYQQVKKEQPAGRQAAK